MSGSGARQTWGLDLSTSPRKTAAVALDWGAGIARVTNVIRPLTAPAIIDLIADSGDEPWAVDVPFGWPDRFVALMADRARGPLAMSKLPPVDTWNDWRTRQIAQRRTDEFLTTQSRIRTRPLPASFQMLGATAAMWVLIEAELAHRGIFIDRSGISGHICETYPRAALAAWGHRQSGKTYLPTLERLFPFLSVSEGWRTALANDDACDALVCALVARAHSLGRTLPPPDEDLDAACREGWIYVSLLPFAEAVGLE